VSVNLLITNAIKLYVYYANKCALLALYSSLTIKYIMIIIKYIAVMVLLGVYESVEFNTWSGALSAEYGPENSQ